MTSISELMELMPVGVRFLPNEEELVNDYLKPKNRGSVSQLCVIPVVNVYNYGPGDLARIFEANSVIKPKDQEYWFFCCPDNYSNSDKLKKRTTESGYWKITCKDTQIEPSVSRKTLAFKIGRGSNADNTDWVIHEYNEYNRPFVLCHLKKKADVKNKKKAGGKTKATTSDEVEPSSSNNASDFEISVPEHTIPELPNNNQPEPSVMDFTFSNGHSNDHNGMQFQFDNAAYFAWASRNADLLPCGEIMLPIESTSTGKHVFPNYYYGDINYSISLEDINSPINNQKELSIVGLPSANVCSNDCNEMQSQFGTIEMEEDTIPEFPINNQQEPFVVALPPANACNDYFNWMQSQLGTTEREENLTEFYKEFISLDDLDKEMMPYISNDSNTLESLGNGDGGISSATHIGTAQALYVWLKRKVELFPLLTVIRTEKKETVFLLAQLHYAVLPLDKEWTMAGFTNAKKGLKLTMDGSAGSCYPGSGTIWDLALDFIEKVSRLFHLSNFSLVGYLFQHFITIRDMLFCCDEKWVWILLCW